MIPLLSRQQHGFTDYSYVPLVAIAPYALGFANVTPAKWLCIILPLLILGGSLITRAEWGLLRIMPLKLHLLLDVMVGLVALSSPWLFGFPDQPVARNTFVVIGIFGICAGLFTRPEEMPSVRPVTAH